MKSLQWLLFILFFSVLGPAQGQIFKKLKKRAEEAVERKLEEKTTRETEKTMDTILGNGKSKKKKRRKKKRANKKDGTDVIGGESENTKSDKNHDPQITIYRKFDFVPGEDIILYDDFSSDAIGEFPAKWDTNSGGEVVQIQNKNWLQLDNGAVYMPLLEKGLPKQFTIEFDLLLPHHRNYNGHGSLFLLLDDNDLPQFGHKNHAQINLSFWKALQNTLFIENKVNGQRIIFSKKEYNLHEVFNQKTHFSIAVNKRRFRLWINEKKVVDVPRLIPEVQLANFKLHMKDYQDTFLISNFKLAEGGQDLRNELISKGRFSTTGILFDSGSARIKPESYGVLKDISSAIKESGISVTVIGHTDSDGSSSANQTLSEKRAAAVKEILNVEFGVNTAQMLTKGKGESEPVADNNSPQGKAKNRRVEFIKN